MIDKSEAPQFVVIDGDLGQGIRRIFGPFSSAGEAIDWIDNSSLVEGPWVLSELIIVEEE